MKTKQMTIRYWNSLPVDSRERAIRAAVPNGEFLAKLFKDAKPNLKDTSWRLIFKLVRIPVNETHYKTVVNGWYIP